MKLMRVVGVGSPFGDDQLGWRVADLLKNNSALQLDLGGRLEVQSRDRPGLMLVDSMSCVDYLWVIDAVKTQHNKIGHVYRFDGESLGDDSGFLSTHGFGVIQAIELAKILRQFPVKTWIYGVEIDSIYWQQEISGAIEVVCEQLAAQLAEEIRAYA